jgi:proteasome lid subunit RPN8/RPN11
MRTNQLEKKRTALMERREKLIERFNEAARNKKNTTRLSDEIRKTNSFLESLDGIAAENAPNPNGPRCYIVSSLFLHDCFKKLTADQDEQFFFVTGAEVTSGELVLDQCAEFAHQRRSRLGVVADMPSTHRVLIKLEQFGHKFLAHFHSHPGFGPDSTHPSGTDRNFQQRLENAGHLAIMAIFSRDGFIRFIRIDRKIEIEIYGDGVERHAENVYRLANLDSA